MVFDLGDTIRFGSKKGFVSQRISGALANSHYTLCRKQYGLEHFLIRFAFFNSVKSSKIVLIEKGI